MCGEASAARRPSPALVWACGGLARHSAVRLLLAQWHGGVMVAWHGEPWPRRDLAALRGSRRRSPCSTVMHAGRRSPGPSPAQAPRSWAFTGLEAPQSLQPCVACGAPQSWALAGPGAVVLGRHRPGRRDLVALRGSRRRSPRGTALHAGRRSPGPSLAQAPWSGAFTGLDGPSPGRAPGHDLAGAGARCSEHQPRRREAPRSTRMKFIEQGESRAGSDEADALFMGSARRSTRF